MSSDNVHCHRQVPTFRRNIFLTFSLLSDISHKRWKQLPPFYYVMTRKRKIWIFYIDFSSAFLNRPIFYILKKKIYPDRNRQPPINMYNDKIYY